MSGATCAKELLCFPAALAAVEGYGMERARIDGLHEFTAHLIAGRYTMTQKQEAAYTAAVACYTEAEQFEAAFGALVALL